MDANNAMAAKVQSHISGLKISAKGKLTAEQIESLSRLVERERKALEEQIPRTLWTQTGSAPPTQSSATEDGKGSNEKKLSVPKPADDSTLSSSGGAKEDS